MSKAEVRIRLEPLSIEFAAAPDAPLLSLLADHGFEFPCGGTGTCGGCGVRVLSGSLPVSEADRIAFSSEKLADGWRLACQARAATSLVLECSQWRMEVLTETAEPGPRSAARSQGLGVAIDLGTTTIAAQLIDLASGAVIAVESGLNPQARYGSDVMNRIRAALDGADLTSLIRRALGQTIAALSRGREHSIVRVLLVGNTAMHHLFSGCSVEPLAHAPFVSPRLGRQAFTPADLGWKLPAGCTIEFAPCLGGFVGSDILAGIVATGLGSGSDLAALIDLGTNGEIAIGNRERIVCASTAAGPAFEAGSIRMGMRAATGAVAHVALRDGDFEAAVIGGVAPRGICGSGLVDAVAAGLIAGAILPSGRLANGAKHLQIAAPVVLDQSDLRELQLAKGAVAAGFKLLLRRLDAGVKDLKAVYLAGAFGNYVDVGSALRIGLLDAPRGLIHPAGNAALHGARLLVESAGDPQLFRIEHISLAADPAFQEEFAACMTFPA
ncbi:MAG: ASKHA domain-containing protein [Acidobacteriota bacterium]